MGVINLGALVEKLKKKMSGDFVSKTTYPSGSDAGVIKVDSTYATAVTTGGKLKATEIAAEAYSEANDAAFISKATLDNVLAAQPAGGVTVTKLYESEVDGNAKSGTLTGLDTYSALFFEVYITGEDRWTVGGILAVASITVSESGYSHVIPVKKQNDLGTLAIGFRSDNGFATGNVGVNFGLKIYGIK